MSEFSPDQPVLRSGPRLEEEQEVLRRTDFGRLIIEPLFETGSDPTRLRSKKRTQDLLLCLAESAVFRSEWIKSLPGSGRCGDSPIKRVHIHFRDRGINMDELRCTQTMVECAGVDVSIGCGRVVLWSDNAGVQGDTSAINPARCLAQDHPIANGAPGRTWNHVPYTGRHVEGDP